jgi:hypothetical protein
MDKRLQSRSTLESSNCWSKGPADKASFGANGLLSLTSASQAMGSLLSLCTVKYGDPGVFLKKYFASILFYADALAASHDSTTAQTTTL